METSRTKVPGWSWLVTKNTFVLFFQDNCGVEYSDEDTSNVSMKMGEVGFDEQLLFFAVWYIHIA